MVGAAARRSRSTARAAGAAAAAAAAAAGSLACLGFPPGADGGKQRTIEIAPGVMMPFVSDGFINDSPVSDPS